MAVSESNARARLGPGCLYCEDKEGNGVRSDERERVRRLPQRA